MVSIISPNKQQSPSKLQLFVKKMNKEKPAPIATTSIEPQHLIRHFKGEKSVESLLQVESANTVARAPGVVS
jgi:hypothetical protein